MVREDFEEVNSHYQELIVVSKEALKRKKTDKEEVYRIKEDYPRADSGE